MLRPSIAALAARVTGDPLPLPEQTAMHNLVDLQMLQEKRASEIEIPPNGISLDLLRAVYCNSSLGLPVRMRAAIAALPHEVPKLGVSIVVNDSDIAARLDRAIARIEATKTKVINEEKVIETKPAPAIEATPILPRLNDRRFRRM